MFSGLLVCFSCFCIFFPLTLHLLHWASRQKKSYRPKCYWQSTARVTFTIECTDVKSLKMFQNSFPSVKIEVLSVLLTETLINAPSFLSLTGQRAWKSVSSVSCPAGFFLWTVSSISFCHVRGSESTAALRGKLNSLYDWMVSVVKLVFYLLILNKVQHLFDWLLGVFVCFFVCFLHIVCHNEAQSCARRSNICDLSFGKTHIEPGPNHSLQCDLNISLFSFST